jgi:hypothetical protein
MRRLRSSTRTLRGTYSHEWEVDSGLYLELRTWGYRNMDDFVEAVGDAGEKMGKDEARRSQGEQ